MEGPTAFNSDIRKEVFDFFSRILSAFPEPVYYESIRGHVTKAPPQVKKYVASKLKGDKLLEYFKLRKNYFDVKGTDILLIRDPCPKRSRGLSECVTSEAFRGRQQSLQSDQSIIPIRSSSCSSVVFNATVAENGDENLYHTDEKLEHEDYVNKYFFDLIIRHEKMNIKSLKYDALPKKVKRHLHLYYNRKIADYIAQFPDKYVIDDDFNVSFNLNVIKDLETKSKFNKSNSFNAEEDKSLAKKEEKAVLSEEQKKAVEDREVQLIVWHADTILFFIEILLNKSIALTVQQLGGYLSQASKELRSYLKYNFKNFKSFFEETSNTFLLDEETEKVTLSQYSRYHRSGYRHIKKTVQKALNGQISLETMKERIEVLEEKIKSYSDKDVDTEKNEDGSELNDSADISREFNISQDETISSASSTNCVIDKQIQVDTIELNDADKSIHDSGIEVINDSGNEVTTDNGNEEFTGNEIIDGKIDKLEKESVKITHQDIKVTCKNRKEVLQESSQKVSYKNNDVDNKDGNKLMKSKAVDVITQSHNNESCEITNKVIKKHQKKNNKWNKVNDAHIETEDFHQFDVHPPEVVQTVLRDFEYYGISSENVIFEINGKLYDTDGNLYEGTNYVYYHEKDKNIIYDENAKFVVKITPTPCSRHENMPGFSKDVKEDTDSRNKWSSHIMEIHNESTIRFFIMVELYCLEMTEVDFDFTVNIEVDAIQHFINALNSSGAKSLSLNNLQKTLDKADKEIISYIIKKHNNLVTFFKTQPEFEVSPPFVKLHPSGMEIFDRRTRTLTTSTNKSSRWDLLKLFESKSYKTMLKEIFLLLNDVCCFLKKQYQTKINRLEKLIKRYPNCLEFIKSHEEETMPKKIMQFLQGFNIFDFPSDQYIAFRQSYFTDGLMGLFQNVQKHFNDVIPLYDLVEIFQFGKGLRVGHKQSKVNVDKSCDFLKNTLKEVLPIRYYMLSETLSNEIINKIIEKGISSRDLIRALLADEQYFLHNGIIKLKSDASNEIDLASEKSYTNIISRNQSPSKLKQIQQRDSKKPSKNQILNSNCDTLSLEVSNEVTDVDEADNCNESFNSKISEEFFDATRCSTPKCDTYPSSDEIDFLIALGEKHPNATHKNGETIGLGKEMHLDSAKKEADDDKNNDCSSNQPVFNENEDCDPSSNNNDLAKYLELLKIDDISDTSSANMVIAEDKKADKSVLEEISDTSTADTATQEAMKSDGSVLNEIFDTSNADRAASEVKKADGSVLDKIPDASEVSFKSDQLVSTNTQELNEDCQVIEVAQDLEKQINFFKEIENDNSALQIAVDEDLKLTDILLKNQPPDQLSLNKLKNEPEYSNESKCHINFEKIASKTDEHLKTDDSLSIPSDYPLQPIQAKIVLLTTDSCIAVAEIDSRKQNIYFLKCVFVCDNQCCCSECFDDLKVGDIVSCFVPPTEISRTMWIALLVSKESSNHFEEISSFSEIVIKQNKKIVNHNVCLKKDFMQPAVNENASQTDVTGNIKQCVDNTTDAECQVEQSFSSKAIQTETERNSVVCQTQRIDKIDTESQSDLELKDIPVGFETSCQTDLTGEVKVIQNLTDTESQTISTGVVMITKYYHL